MLLDEFLPEYDVRTTHSIRIAARPESVYASLRAADFDRWRVVRTLFTLRMLPAFSVAPRETGRRLRREVWRDPVMLERVLEQGFTLTSAWHDRPFFLLIDVMTGSEIPASVLVDLAGARQLRFESVERPDARVRLYGSAAVVTGQTRLQGRFGEQSFGAHSRYTHVYVRVGDAWQLASAQGTTIAATAV
jgi:hypothetical protein